MMTGGSVPASSPTSPAASGGGASPRNGDQGVALAGAVTVLTGATVDRLGNGTKMGGIRGGGAIPGGGHPGFVEAAGGGRDADGFAAGRAFTGGIDAGRSTGFGTGPDTSPVG